MDSTRHLKTAILACGSLRKELSFITDRIQTHPPDLFFLDSALHLTPRKMLNPLQRMLNSLANDFEQVVLGFGLCSNGTVGLTVPTNRTISKLMVPRAHDCMDFFLNSAGNPKKRDLPPGHYFLTPGMILTRKDPLGILKDVYEPKMGKEMALWGLRQELHHYSHFVLFLNGLGNTKQLIARAKENADFFDKKLIVEHKELSFLERLANGPYTHEEFFILGPGEKVSQELFFSDQLLP